MSFQVPVEAGSCRLVEAICRGTPSEMGLEQGRALRGKILAARRVLAELESFRLQQPRGLPYLPYRWLAERRAIRFLRGPLERDFPEMGQRLRGIATGAGLRPQAVFLFNALEPLLSAAGGCTACPGACSAVAVRGSRSASGEPIIARNFDYLPMVQPCYTIRECRPETGQRSLEFTAAPLAGAVDGMNESGLCIAYDYAFVTDVAPAPAPPISMAIAEALSCCETVAQAAERIAARPRWGGGMLMLADATGDIASLELSSTRSFLRRPAAGEDVLFHTNSFFSAPMQPFQIAADAVYTDRAPKALRGRRLHQSSEMRNRRFEELLATRERLGPAELAALMADHGSDGVPGDFTPCVHGSYWHTTACLQLFPASRRMRVAYDTACRAKYAEIELH